MPPIDLAKELQEAAMDLVAQSEANGRKIVAYGLTVAYEDHGTGQMVGFNVEPDALLSAASRLIHIAQREIDNLYSSKP